MAYKDVILATAGLQSYYRLGEPSGSTATDQTGAVDLTYGASTAAPTLGVAGALTRNPDTAADFDGVNDIASTATDVYGFTGTANFSIEGWFKTPNPLGGVTDFMVSKERNDGAAARQGWGLILTTGNVFRGQRWVTNVNVDTTSTTTLSVATWYHVVWTYDGTNGRIYVNAGTAQSSATDTNAIIAASPTTARFGIGAMDPGGSGAFTWGKATIDEVAIYNVALSAATITAHYNAGTNPTSLPMFRRPYRFFRRAR